jgi:acetyl esterase
MKMRLHFLLLGTLAVNLCLSGGALAQTGNAGDAQPDAYTYERVGGKEMKAYVFEPPHSDYGKPRAAMLVFHGGAWNHGSAEWTFGQARYFTSLGMVGISVDYRLANGDTVTPFDAAEDARAAVRWARSQAALLNIDPKRIGAYGESAGGLLAAATAITEESPTKGELSAVPNALVLVSPALNVEKSARFLALAGKRRDIASIELGEHVRRGLPPTIILTGAMDAAIQPRAAGGILREDEASKEPLRIGNLSGRRTHAGAARRRWGDERGSRENKVRCVSKGGPVFGVDGIHSGDKAEKLAGLKVATRKNGTGTKRVC